MDDLRRLEAKGLARAKLRAKRRRVRAIRARAFVGSVALFAVAWAIVFAQLVSGNDPVLNRSGASSGRSVATAHRRTPAQAAPPEETETAAEPELVPEVEAEPEPEPEVEPVITSAS